MQEMHRFLRSNRARNGQIRFRRMDGADIVGCLVKDFSRNGATLFVAAGIEIPPEFELSLDGIGGRDCWIKWRSDGAVGVEFDPAYTPNVP